MKQVSDRENRKSSSLIIYALRVAIPIGVIVLFTTWLIESHLLQSTIEAELREHIEEIDARKTAQIQNNLDSVKSFAKSLGVNDLIINGLIDLEGRDAYIPIFFRSLIAPLAADASVSLVDYTGRGIVSSAIDNAMPPVSPTMVEEGAFLIDSHRLLVVEPILISGSSEGAIVLNYPASSFDELFGNTALPHGLFVAGYNDLVVYSTNTTLASVGELNSGEPLEDWLEVRSTIPQSNLSVVVGSSLDVALESMATVQAVRIVGLVILLTISIGLVLLSAFIVSRPLKQFSAIISTIKNLGDLNKHLDTKGPREIAEIATTFNRMGDWLQSTTVSRNYMDNILASITEGVITINPKGLITTFNTGAVKIFGYESSEVVGLNVSMLLPSAERDDHDTYLYNTRLHAPQIIGQNRDLQGCRKDGSLFPIELIVTPLTEDGNQGFVGTIRDITERKVIEESLEQRSQELNRINKELEYMALNDSLTGLGNRNLFTDRLGNLIASCKRNQEVFALLMMDLNKFKEVNDTHGHEAGDEVLREVGKRLKKLGRDADSFFRLGGDEFAALVTTGLTGDGITIMADRITKSIEVPVEFKSFSLEIGISIGIVLFPEHSEDEEELLRLADAAMYEAKRDHLEFSISSASDK